MRPFLLAGFIAALTVPMAQAAEPAANPPPAVSQFVEISAHDQVRQMGRGANIIGSDPFWEAPGKSAYRAEHFARLRAAGFANVRLVLPTQNYLDAQGRLDPKWLNRLDWLVATAKANGLTVVLETHDVANCMPDAAGCASKLADIWRQLASHYRNEPNTVLFELYEPDAAYGLANWNAALPKLLAAIRQSNPTRNIIVGGVQYNGRKSLPALVLPAEDQHLIATFHYFEPLSFTHQGAPWMPADISSLKDVPFGTSADIAQVDADFKALAEWSKASGRPVYLGEFGSYDAIRMQDRVAWTQTVARTAETYGMAHAYWHFSSGFLLYDFKTETFVAQILNALVPE